METHSNTLAWKIPWTEEPGRLKSMGSQRVRHDWVTSLSFSFLSKLKVFCFFFNYITWGGNRCFYTCVTGQKELVIPLISGYPVPWATSGKTGRGSAKSSRAENCRPPSTLIPVSQPGGIGVLRKQQADFQEQNCQGHRGSNRALFL